MFLLSAGSARFLLTARHLTRFPAVCEGEAMKPRSRTPALWVLASRRRPSTTADPVEAERRRVYKAMNPGERLARALALSSFALKLRQSARLSRRP